MGIQQDRWERSEHGLAIAHRGHSQLACLLLSYHILESSRGEGVVPCNVGDGISQHTAKPNSDPEVPHSPGRCVKLLPAGRARLEMHPSTQQKAFFCPYVGVWFRCAQPRAHVSLHSWSPQCCSWSIPQPLRNVVQHICDLGRYGDHRCDFQHIRR